MSKDKKQQLKAMLFPLFTGAGLIISHLIFNQMLYGMVVGCAIWIIVSSIIEAIDTRNKDKK